MCTILIYITYGSIVITKENVIIINFKFLIYISHSTQHTKLILPDNLYKVVNYPIVL